MVYWVEPNVGEWLHSLIQRNLIVAIARKYPHVSGVPELRLRTRESRHRLPDVCVLRSPPTTRYLLEAAHIAIEILSEAASMSKLMETPGSPAHGSLAAMKQALGEGLVLGIKSSRGAGQIRLEFLAPVV